MALSETGIWRQASCRTKDGWTQEPRPEDCASAPSWAAYLARSRGTQRRSGAHRGVCRLRGIEDRVVQRTLRAPHHPAKGLAVTRGRWGARATHPTLRHANRAGRSTTTHFALTAHRRPTMTPRHRRCGAHAETGECFAARISAWARSEPHSEGRRLLSEKSGKRCAFRGVATSPSVRHGAWVPQGRSDFVRPAEASRDLLPDGFPFDPGWTWLKAIGFGEEIVKQTEEHRRRRDVASELGFEDEESLDDARWFAQLDSVERRRFKVFMRAGRVPTSRTTNRETSSGGPSELEKKPPIPRNGAPSSAPVRCR